MNAKPKINQKLPNSLPPGGAGDWCPLQHIKTLMGLSRRRLSKDEILRLIDSRQIRWAWDIARRGARRPEVRIWRESLVACLAGEEGGGSDAIPSAEDLSLDQVIASILPRPAAVTLRTATLRIQELQKRFLCCRMHIAGLIADGELSAVAPARPGEAPAVLYRSALEFLRRRSMSI